LSRYPVLQKFQDVFLEDISEFPPHREVDFSIELFLGAALASKAPYMIKTPELVELKLKLKEMLDKGYLGDVTIFFFTVLVLPIYDLGGPIQCTRQAFPS